ncbi:MAG: GxxExxY protein [Methanosarcinales archaeon]|nr:GxxExxY protein [Methanosarcinales archaeon]
MFANNIKKWLLRWFFPDFINNSSTLPNNEVVGNYVADIIVNDKVILEIKAIKELSNIHEVQLVNYLKATGIEVGCIRV